VLSRKEEWIGLILLSREEECCQDYSVIKGGRMEEWLSGLYCCQGRKNVARLICVIKGGKMEEWMSGLYCCQGGLNGGRYIVLSRQRGGMWVLIAKEVRRNVSKANGVIKGEGKNSGGKIL
jgi:hypothetical protein